MYSVYQVVEQYGLASEEHGELLQVVNDAFNETAPVKMEEEYGVSSYHEDAEQYAEFLNNEVLQQEDVKEVLDRYDIQNADFVALPEAPRGATAELQA